MTPNQQYVDALLEAVSSEPFPSEDQRDLLLAIKDRLSGSSDLQEELRRLYRVEGLAEFALALMWTTKQIDRNPDRSEATAEDQYLVSMKFRHAFGALHEEETDAPGQEAGEDALGAHGEPEPEPEAPEPAPEERAPVNFAPDAAEDTFPQLLEKFVIAMQAGVDDRTRLFDKVVHSAREIGQPDSDYSSDLVEFCSKLVDFLTYAKANNYMDDVRTLNILSTISDAMSSWDTASIESRSGLLSEGIKVLAEFRTHYE